MAGIESGKIESCKPITPEAINAKLKELEIKVLFNTDNFQFDYPKNHGESTSISYKGIKLDLNILPKNFQKVKDLSSKIINDYLKKDYTGNLYSYESILTTGEVSDNEALMLLQVDNRLTEILDTVMLSGDDFNKVFGLKPTRSNGFIKIYASFLQGIINDVKKEAVPNCEIIEFNTPIIQKIPPKNNNDKVIASQKP